MTSVLRDIPTVDTVIVAVPARNEEDTIRACLASIDVAASRVRELWSVDVRLVVAADACSDRTVPSVQDFEPSAMHVDVISGSWGSAGGARCAAAAWALADCSAPLDRVWLANTDADCAVPPDWLSSQLVLSAQHAAVAGIVQLQPAEGTEELIARFRSTYLIDGDRHEHVHGANLGLRADVYTSVGGWCRHTEVGEDHGLWHRVRAAGHRVVHATAVRVHTSARTVSRVEGGFATGLGLLVGQSAA